MISYAHDQDEAARKRAAEASSHPAEGGEKEAPCCCCCTRKMLLGILIGGIVGILGTKVYLGLKAWRMLPWESHPWTPCYPESASGGSETAAPSKSQKAAELLPISAAVKPARAKGSSQTMERLARATAAGGSPSPAPKAAKRPESAARKALHQKVMGDYDLVALIDDRVQYQFQMSDHLEALNDHIKWLQKDTDAEAKADLAKYKSRRGKLLNKYSKKIDNLDVRIVKGLERQSMSFQKFKKEVSSICALHRIPLSSQNAILALHRECPEGPHGAFD